MFMKLHQKIISDVATFMLVPLCVIYLFAMHGVIPNNGGSGSDLPEPLLVWSLVFSMVAVGYLFFFWRQVYLSRAIRLIMLGSLLMTAPLLWSPRIDWILDALPRFGGLWGGVALYILLINCAFTRRQKQCLFYVIAIAALMQAFYSLVALHYPQYLPEFEQEVLKKGPGIGVFQQRNVTASFLAVGGGVLLFILNAPLFLGDDKKTDTLRQIFSVSGTAIIYCALTELQSRIGWLSGLCVFIGMLTLYWRKTSPVSRRLLLLSGPLAGISIGVLLMQTTLLDALLQHDGSNLQRIMILRETWNMILIHPFKGWGYGSYVWNFTHYIADRTFPIDNGASVITHPHNEVLYWWVEGGLLALVGILILCRAGMVLLFSSPDNTRFAIFLCVLPLLLHTQVEYPFYQSSVHWLTCIVLLSLIDDKRILLTQQTDEKRGINAGAIVVSTLSFFLAIMVAVTLRNTMILTKFEQQPDRYYQDVLVLRETGIGTERFRRLQAEALIVDYQHNNNTAKLRQFSVISERWLNAWVDADIYDNLIKVAYFFSNNIAGNKLKDEAHKIFTEDKRFG